jgi:hypothetical protein
LSFARSSILAASPFNLSTAQRSSERPTSNRPPRPERCAEEPPGHAAFAVLLAQLTLCPIPASRSTRSHTHSNTLPTGTGHNVLLGDRPASQQGASSAPRSGRVSIVYVLSRVVFSVWLAPVSSIPRARVVARLERSSPMRKGVYALPPRVSCLVSDLSRFGDPATRPPRGLPSPPTRGLPPRSRVPRASTQQPHQHTAGTEALFQSLPPSLFELRRTSRLPAQILSESQAAIAAGQSKPCPSRRRDRHPVLLGLAPSACLRGIGSNGQFSFFVPPAEILLPRFKVYSLVPHCVPP